MAWIGFAISTNDGTFVLSATDGDIDAYASTPRELGVYTSVCYIPEALFNAGQYTLSLYAAIGISLVTAHKHPLITRPRHNFCLRERRATTARGTATIQERVNEFSAMSDRAVTPSVTRA